MLTTAQTDVWGLHHTLDIAGTRARFDANWWGMGGRLTVDDDELRLHCSAWGTRYTLTADDRTLATAERVGRKHWSVTAGDRTYRFERTSLWSQRQALTVDGEPVGSARLTSFGTTHMSAELPGMPPFVQAFTAATLLSQWQNHVALIPVMVAVFVPLIATA